ncbi:amino acid adenylation domain-containing protein, partial [Bacillus sp. ISL-53]|nr:amino acid adenylation domain-containing protein [Bacillus sp. ISL-53]
IDDNFFQLGGHSLKTIQIRSRIKQQFGIEMVLKDIFEHQTIRELAVVLKETVGGTKKPNSGTISPGEQVEYYPMSHAQQRLFLLNSLEPDNLSYNMPLAVELNGPLDQKGFEKAVQMLIIRHEGLRTTFSIKDGEPVQQVSETPLSDCLFFDLSHLSDREQQQKLEDIRKSEEETSFNLNTGPLFHVKLYKLENNRHVLWLNMHHIIGDFWSWQVLMKDLTVLYESYCQGETPSLPSLTVQYKEYAKWQNGRLEQGELDDAENYWIEKLSGELPILELPLDHPRPPIRTFTAAQENYMLNIEQVKKLKEIGHQQGATMFMTILSAVGAFLSKLGGQQDIIIGTPEAGRNRMELEGLIGFFVNTLPLRICLSNDQTFNDLLNQCKKVALEAYTHHEYPFDLLVENAKVDRDLSRSPIFSVMFQLVHSTENFQLGDLSCRSLETETTMTNFDLMIICTETPEGLDIKFRYRNDLFDMDTIQRWIRYFSVMIDSILKDSNQKLTNLAIIDEQEQCQLLIEWNDTKNIYPRDSCIHQLIEQRVLQCADKIAVEYGDQHLTYHLLNEKSNQLAHYLSKQGVKVGDKIAVCMNRSLELVVTLLGIMKAGGSYIPIDPILPENRIKYMLEDSNAKVALGDHSTLSELAPEHILIIDPQRLAIQIENESRQVPAHSISAEQAAYLIYTSGSTGKPKGVQVSHRSVVNFLISMGEKPGIHMSDRLLSVTTMSFDIFGLELFLPLITGATVILATREETMSGFHLAKLIEGRGISIMQATPATWRLLLESDWQGCPNLKILCGGESLKRELASDLISRSKELWNMYGPTETTIWSAVHHVTELEGPVKIGHPVMNTELYILDSQMQPVPIGISGELYIGGDGVALGYWNRPNLTAERFLPNPFTERGKIYRTGDLVRHLPEGTIEYLGRLDHQVKVRGYRIELSEIEAVLLQHSSISEAVVITKKDMLDDKKLIVYLVSSENRFPSQEELRKHCLTQLPEYMVPATFIELDKIPLTPNGKVNRKKLEDLNVELPFHTYTPPRDLNELSVTKIWEELLNVKSIGIHDHFFNIGGNSLKALLLQNTIRERFGVELPLNALFQNPTVADLCTHLRKNNSEHKACLVKLQQGDGSHPPLFMIHPHGGGVLPYIHLVKELGPEETIYGIQAVGYDSSEEPLTSIDNMVFRYLEEIRRVVPQGPYRFMGWSFGGTIAYELARQLEHLGEKIEFIGLLDAQPFDRKGDIHNKFTERDALEYIVTLFDFNPEMFGKMNLEDGLTLLLQKAKEDGKWAQSMTLESIRRKIRVLVACSEAIESYQYKTPISSNINLFCVNEISKHNHSHVNPKDWVDRTTGVVSVFDVQGDHYSMVEHPYVSKLAQSIRSSLYGIKAN